MCEDTETVTFYYTLLGDYYQGTPTVCVCVREREIMIMCMKMDLESSVDFCEHKASQGISISRMESYHASTSSIIG
jgi:hypothetical protein